MKSDKMHDECAVVAVYGNKGASMLCMKMLHMLQHRGPEASGITIFNNGELNTHKGMGWVQNVYSTELLKKMEGLVGIGHNRYPTCGEGSSIAGDDNINAAQPHTITSKGGIKIAGASNGDVPRYKYLRERLIKLDYQLKTHNDGEVLVALIAYYIDQGNDPVEAITALMHDEDLKGAAFSCVFIIDGQLFVFRDPLGFRPLSLARYGKAYVVASESCAFDIIGADYIRDVFSGEIVQVDDSGERSRGRINDRNHYHCVFEWIYFARPDSVMFGSFVSTKRKEFGTKLWESNWKNIIPDLDQLSGDSLRQRLDEYVVIAIPDSSNSIALGVSTASGIPFDIGLIRSHYTGRSFLATSQKSRQGIVALKFNPDRAVVNGKRVIVVDDSIVRGNTTRKIIRMLRLAGAIEIIVLIGSPPVKFSCLFGIDTPTTAELKASTMSIDEIRLDIEADQLYYLTDEQLCECLPKNGTGFCRACFNGDYPYIENIPVEKLK